MENGIYIVEINFNPNVDFEFGKENVSIEIENGTIKSSSHELQWFDQMAVISLIRNGKCKRP